jgi:cellulose synthase/poly-beta-1,6-N-acetylglucosamine synthase-like glycosyltransferase
MIAWLDATLALLGVPVLLCSAYLFLATVFSGSLRTPAYGTPKSRFRILVPAHDEAASIEGTVRNLLSLDYPRELFDVLVIADNCSDDTAALARAAGAKVLERKSETERGKGYALHHAFERLPAEVDAAVVIDADTVASPNLLDAFAARLEAGAQALQADYAVRNPNAAWRTRLMAIALGAFHIVRSRARERFGVSAGLRGNGMCFTPRVLREVPHEAYSIVEDVEYGIRLAEAGHRVVYVDEGHVYGEMVSSAKAARSQRERWEGGRVALAKRHGFRLLREGLKGNRVELDIGLDLLLPPLSRVAVAAMLGSAIAWACGFVWGGFVVSRTLFSACAAAIVLYVLRGWALSGTGWAGLADLAFAPVYVIWKMTLAKRKRAQWIRTTREPDA